MIYRVPRDAVLVVGGVITASLGTYLPWLRTNPALPAGAEIPTIYLSGMATGIEGVDFLALGLLGIVLVSRSVGPRERMQSALTLLPGVGIVLLCVHYLLLSSSVGFGATFVPALGWYLTVLGGSSLTVAGGARLFRTRESPALGETQDHRSRS